MRARRRLPVAAVLARFLPACREEPSTIARTDFKILKMATQAWVHIPPMTLAAVRLVSSSIRGTAGYVLPLLTRAVLATLTRTPT